MASFNPELAAKALERRVAGLESKVDALDKAARAAGDPRIVVDLQKQVADQKQRIDNLEKLVKTLAETRGESKSVALEKLEKTVSEIDKNRQMERDKLIAELRRTAMSGVQGQLQQYTRPEDVRKLLEDQLTQVMKTEAAIRTARDQRAKVDWDRNQAAAIAEVERTMKAEVEQAMKLSARLTQEATDRAMKHIVDSQLAVLSARIGSLESAVKKL